ncbi:hypothetical protein DYB32_005535 [Aphanomyces invadans]|uniref:Uncharacterized protein n=1 Tax=Aphanomyces invadans TaxID=157072 RepID=A0A3R6VKU3_9STRA|nr:hypothetical protein DYB32_005535 [Aphanomyces invadans]
MVRENCNPYSPVSLTFECSASYQYPDCSLLGSGEYQKQLCQVLAVYCGTPLLIIQLMMSMAAGMAIVVLLWVVVMVANKHRTSTEDYLVGLCLFTGMLLMAVVGCFYWFVFSPILKTAFYADERSRCKDNEKGRSCWSIRMVPYATMVASGLYCALTVALTSLSGVKAGRYKVVVQEYCRKVLADTDARAIRESTTSTVRGSEDSILSRDSIAPAS